MLQIPVGKEQLGEMHDAFVELQRVEWGNALRCENKIRREYDGHGLSGHAIVVFIPANVGDEMQQPINRLAAIGAYVKCPVPVPNGFLGYIVLACGRRV